MPESDRNPPSTQPAVALSRSERNVYLVAACTMAIAALMFVRLAPHSAGGIGPGLTLILLALAHTLADYYLRAHKRWAGLRFVTPLVTAGLVTGGLIVAGGGSRLALALYLPTVVIASATSGRRVGLGTAAVATLGYGLALLVHPPSNALPDFALVSANVLLAAAVTGAVAERERSASLSLIARQAEAAARDAAELLRAQQTLRESEARFHALAENSLEAVAFLNDRGAIGYASPATTRVLGFGLDEFVGQDLFQLAHPEDAAFLGELVHQALRSPGHRAPARFRLRHRDGQWRWMEGVISSPQLLSGARTVVANYRDITDRVQREREREAIVTVAAALRVAPGRADMQPTVLDQVLSLLQADGAALFMPDPANGDSVAELGRGLWAHWTGLRLPSGEGVTGYVIGTGQPYVNNDAGSDPRLVHPHLLNGLDCAVCVPLMAQEQTIGALWAGRRTEIRGEELRLLSAIGDIAASAIHRATLTEQTQRLVSEFAALYQTARDLAVQQDLPTLLDTIVRRAASLLRARGGVMFLYHPSEGQLELTVGREFAAPPGLRYGLGEGMAGRVAESRQPLVVDDYHSWSGRSAKVGGALVTAAVQVPMLYGGELVGVLGVHEVNTTRKFTEAEARLLALFAGQAASAVHGSRLLEQTARRLAELEAVNRLSTALRAAHTLDEMPPRVLEETLAALDVAAGAVWLFDPSHGTLRQAVARGWFTQIRGVPIAPNEGIAGQVFATGQPHVSREFATDARTMDAARSHIPAGWGGACVPIRSSDQTVGVMFVSVAVPRELTRDEIRLLNTLTEISGSAIQRARLHAETQQRLHHLGALRTIDLAITASLDLRVTLNVILDQVTTHLGVDAAAVLLLDSRTQTLEYAAGRGFRATALARTRLRLGEGAAGRAALDRHIVRVADLRDHALGAARARGLAQEGFIGYFGVPLVAKAQVKGVLEIFQRGPLDGNPEWLDFMETLASQAAIAIDNATLFDELQRSNAELALAYDTTLEGWSRALDLRDRETEGHTRRVTEMTLRLSRHMGLSDDELVHVRRGALLHDIGKMGIPDHILLKPGPLTDDEWAVMRRHAEYAYEMLSPITYLRPALEIPYAHHERWDGTGYPRGLKGEAIPASARIFAVADVWDALRSDRPYRRAWDEGEVRDYIHSLSGRHFDPKVVTALWQVLHDSGPVQ